ncbi:MAG: FAD-dependent oxidoreductase [Eubacteriales bacterium]
MKTNVSRETIYHETQFCVIGGGLAGLCAAIAAARKGTKTVLVQERPVLGGNASSEVRMWVRGANGKNDKETGIVSELDLENIYKNPSMNFSLWDSVMYGAALREPNLTLMLNTTCIDAKAENNRIESVTCWQMTTYTFHTIHAEVFADCSGDSILAPLVGAKWTKGREARAEYNESIAPEQADLRTMGMSCLIQARQCDHKVAFVKPDWAYTYESDADLPHREHSLKDSGTNFWWMELGGEDDSIRDTERLREELLKIAFGIWDHMKNHGDHGADNWELDWVGFLPGKRESRRYIGAHVLTQNDIEAGGQFEDIAAYGGWTMDDHNPAGYRYIGSPTTHHPAPSPYGIPYRSMYSINIENLLFAGRNISATHSALSSTRVMATCAVIGQAVGNAAALCCRYGTTPDGVYRAHLRELQDEILFDGCYLPGLHREMSPCMREAHCNLSDGQQELLFNGLERPDKNDSVNYVSRETGESIEFAFARPTEGTMRLVLDLDYSRKSVSDDGQFQRYSMRCNVPMALKPLKMPANLAKHLRVTAVMEDGSTKVLYESEHNDKHLIFAPTGGRITALKAEFFGAWQSEVSNVFAFELVERA